MNKDEKDFKETSEQTVDDIEEETAEAQTATGSEEVEGDTPTEDDEVSTLQQTLAEKEDQIVRLSAEIQNMRRRQQNERQDLLKYRSQSLAQQLLPAMDSLERALATEVDGEANENLKKGIEMVHQGMLKAFDDEGIEILNPLGEIFDPNFHQSVSSVPKTDEQKDEEIVEVYQKGYVLNDRVLRPAMVIIAQ